MWKLIRVILREEKRRQEKESFFPVALMDAKPFGGRLSK